MRPFTHIRPFASVLFLFAVFLFGADDARAATYYYRSAVYAGRIPAASPCPGGSCANFGATMRAEGTITTPAPLPASLPMSDISALVSGYQFSDGLTTYASTDPQVRLISLRAQTDAAGVPIAFEFRAYRWQTPAPYGVGKSVDQLFLTLSPQAVATHNAPCATFVAPNSCTGTPGGHPQMSSANTSVADAPTMGVGPLPGGGPGPGPVPPVAAPTPVPFFDDGALAVLAVLLLALRNRFART